MEIPDYIGILTLKKIPGFVSTEVHSFSQTIQQPRNVMQLGIDYMALAIATDM